MNTTEQEYFQRDVVRMGEVWREGLSLIRRRYWLLVGMSLIALLINTVPIVCYGPMFCGLSLALLKLYDDEEIEFNMLFKGFDYFGPSTIAALIAMGFSIAAGILIIGLFSAGVIGVALLLADAKQSLDGGAVLALVLVGYATYFFVFAAFMAATQTLTAFAFPLIVERRLEPWPAVKLAARGGWANFRPLFWLYFLLFLAMILGSMCMYIGFIFLPPLALGVFIISYRKVFPKTSPPPRA